MRRTSKKAAGGRSTSSSTLMALFRLLLMVGTPGALGRIVLNLVVEEKGREVRSITHQSTVVGRFHHLVGPMKS